MDLEPAELDSSLSSVLRPFIWDPKGLKVSAASCGLDLTADSILQSLVPRSLNDPFHSELTSVLGDNNKGTRYRVPSFLVSATSIDNYSKTLGMSNQSVWLVVNRRFRLNITGMCIDDYTTEMLFLRRFSMSCMTYREDPGHLGL